ncbi:GerW family sporulation protein [Limnochorda pilosa]|uniref:Sporulation protein YtfJ n=1 Tax=Limnochorda pilosa TaxID=1555112 RepID=A0A0K2SLC0_LIMPI|nr:GerW family sporulation protein [Limnochorda pilosa]BAS27634.1 sporulation protein YtfJ [Limnochorda pilosa]
MAEATHPMDSVMRHTMENLKEMVAVNTILGDPVETPDGSVILPVSRVSFGFAAGGSEFQTAGAGRRDEGHAAPFGGGSGAGMSVSPVAFLVVGQGDVRLLPVEANPVYDRLIDLAPKLADRLIGIWRPDLTLSEEPAGDGYRRLDRESTTRL